MGVDYKRKESTPQGKPFLEQLRPSRKQNESNKSMNGVTGLLVTHKLNALNTLYVDRSHFYLLSSLTV